jgi:hypothetical protein
MTGQSVASKSCVCVTKRPIATAADEWMSENPQQGGLYTIQYLSTATNHAHLHLQHCAEHKDINPTTRPLPGSNYSRFTTQQAPKAQHGE